MSTLKEKIIEVLKVSDGLTDRELTDKIMGHNQPQQSINQACRGMEGKKVLKRTYRGDGKIGNYLDTTTQGIEIKVVAQSASIEQEGMREDKAKEILDNYLNKQGWETNVAWGKKQGIDIDATRGNERWIIEVKGCGSLNAMRVNYFIAILGETLQRMGDPNAKYSIALPDMEQYRNLWDRLPKLAKQRTGITILFVKEDGTIEEIEE